MHLGNKRSAKGMTMSHRTPEKNYSHQHLETRNQIRRQLIIRGKPGLTVNGGRDRDRTSSLRIDMAQRERKFLNSEIKETRQ